MNWPISTQRTDVSLLERERVSLKVLRLSRGGPTIFFVGSNSALAAALARRTEDLPISICYFWSAEMLNRSPFWNFAMGLVMGEEWNRLLETANGKVREMLSKTPVYILVENRQQFIAENRFPTQVVEVLTVDSGMLGVVAEVLGLLGELEKPESHGQIIPLERRRENVQNDAKLMHYSYSFALLDENSTFSNSLWKVAKLRQIRLDLFRNIQHYLHAKTRKYDVLLIDYNLGSILGVDEKSIEGGLIDALGEVPMLLLCRGGNEETALGKPFIKKTFKDFNHERIIDAALKLRYEAIRAA